MESDRISVSRMDLDFCPDCFFGVDYLIARPDVIADRIGTFGCSGGGTAAAYLAAMEPRIRVAAVASYLTSFKELLPGNGPQDQGQRSLKRCSGKDFEHELVVPTATTAFHDEERWNLTDPAAPVSARNAPEIVKCVGQPAEFAWEEFFQGELANPHTRKNYIHAVKKFLAWCEERSCS